MQSKHVVIGGILVGALVLTGCGSSESLTANGRMDDIKFSAAKFKQKTRTVDIIQRKCAVEWKTETVGTGKNRRTVRKRDNVCKNVKVGSRKESYRSKVKDANYCIELDSYEYSPGKWRDNAWFTVSASTYNEYKYKGENAKVRRMPYNHEGC